MKENEIREVDKYPNKIKRLLKQGKEVIDQWDKEKNEKELINIEKSLVNINNMD